MKSFYEVTNMAPAIKIPSPVWNSRNFYVISLSNYFFLLFPPVKEANFEAQKFEYQILLSLFILSNFINFVIISGKDFYDSSPPPQRQGCYFSLLNACINKLTAAITMRYSSVKNEIFAVKCSIINKQNNREQLWIFISS